MPVTLACPHCRQTVAVEAAPGQQVRCGICGAMFVMPAIGNAAESSGGAGFDPAALLNPQRKGVATAALVLGIVGLALCPPVFGLLALILGIVALVQAGRRPTEYGGRGMAIAGICCGAASLVIVIPLQLAILLPSLSRARELAMRTVCAAKLRGIGQSCHIYANENDEWFPQSLQVLIDTGQMTSAELICPSSDSASGSDFILIPNVRATAPVDWIIAYEDPANHGGEGGNILYVDSRVEFVKEPAFSQELARVRKEMDAAEPEGDTPGGD